MSQETYLCEKCKTEFTVSSEEAIKKRNICPTGCTRNFLIFLGDNEEDIKKRKAKFSQPDPLRDIEVNPEIDDYDDGNKHKGKPKEQDSTSLNLGF